METPPVPINHNITALDKRTVHTGLEGKTGFKETIHQFEAYSYFCEASDQYPERRINEIIKMVADKFNQSPRTVLNWYKGLNWAHRYREWRGKQKELSLSDPDKKIIEMVKDLEKLSRQGSSVLYTWLTTMDPKKLLGKEIELIANLVLRATEIAAKHSGSVSTEKEQGIHVKGHNVQLVIKE